MFTKYKKITEKIIEELKVDNDIELLMEDREKILKEIEIQGISKEELIKEYNRLNIKELDDSLGQLIKYKMAEIKVSIDEGKVRRTAFSSYASSNREENYFARKV